MRHVFTYMMFNLLIPIQCEISPHTYTHVPLKIKATMMHGHERKNRIMTCCLQFGTQ